MSSPMSSPGQTRSVLSIAGRAAAAAGMLAAAAACAAPEADLARRAPSLLAGMPESELYACAGVPQRSAAVGGTEYLAYRRGQTIVTRDVDYDENPWLRARGVRYFEPEVSYHRVNYACEATVAVSDGIVRDVTYGPGHDITLCYEILASCLPAPQTAGR